MRPHDDTSLVNFDEDDDDDDDNENVIRLDSAAVARGRMAFQLTELIIMSLRTLSQPIRLLLKTVAFLEGYCALSAHPVPQRMPLVLFPLSNEPNSDLKRRRFLVA